AISMKTFLHILLFLCCQLIIANYSSAQVSNTAKINPKAVKLYNQGMEAAADNKFENAISYFLQAIYLDSNYVDAYLSLAGVYGQSKKSDLAVEYYEKAIRKDTAATKVFKLTLAINLAGMGNFHRALDVVNDYLSNPNLGEASRKAGEFRKRCFEFALEQEKKNTGRQFTPKNAGDKINSPVSEYFPSLSIDGKELFFTRKVRGYDEDFFSAKKENTDWNNSAPLGGNVNTDENEGAQMISQDGEWLVFAASNRRDGWGGFDIYISFLTPKGWSEPINLGGKINTEQWESQPCLSPDKRDLYFASKRHGGYGGSDIYVSHLQTDGTWSTPENLGPTINTSSDEQCPFIHADNQSLFFTSNGLPGYGGTDLFYSRKGPKAAWSVPENLGYPLNTIYDEGTLFIAADAKTAYYASDRSDSKGGMDIYVFDLPENIRPNKTLWVKGKVFDQKTTKGLPSSVELIDLGTKQLISQVQTDERGNYLITLPVGKDYAFNVNRKGYLFYSDNFFLSDHSIDSIYEKNIALQPIEANASVVLKNVFFDVNKFDLKPASEAELDILVRLMNENPTLKIQIGGHTDNVGKPADNLALSNNRAKAVVTYLVSKGIVATRLSAKGFGETQPIDDNKTEEGRAKNRRTEMKVISQ
ncbi:MAG TPA: OmpA family protein, partial [Chitinophagaceae bacterium]|nr:OmpA family protein [Chitinophagaceae bacterium]